METPKNEKKLWTALKEDYEPIPWGWFKFFAGLAIVSAWMSSIWFAWKMYQHTQSIVSVVYMVVVGGVLGLGILYYGLCFIFDFGRFFKDDYGRWPFNWIAKYWRRNVLGYRIVHTKCLESGEKWARIVSRQGKKVLYTDPQYYQHHEHCKKHRASLGGGGIVSVNIPIGGWFTKRIFAVSSASIELFEYKLRYGCGCRVRIYHEEKGLPNPTLRITDGDGDTVACYLSHSFEYISEALSNRSVWMHAVQRAKTTDEYLKIIKKSLGLTDKNLRKSTRLSSNLFHCLGSEMSRRLKESSRLGHSLEGLEIRAWLLRHILQFVQDNQDLLNAIAPEHFEEELEEVNEKLEAKKAANEERKKKKAQAGKKPPVSKTV